MLPFIRSKCLSLEFPTECLYMIFHSLGMKVMVVALIITITIGFGMLW